MKSPVVKLANSRISRAAWARGEYYSCVLLTSNLVPKPNGFHSLVSGCDRTSASWRGDVLVICTNQRDVKPNSTARPLPFELITQSLNSPWTEGGGTAGDTWPEPLCRLLTLCLSVSAQHVAVVCKCPWISFVWGKCEPNEQAGLFVSLA